MLWQIMSSAPITHPHRQRSRDSIDPLLSSANNLTSKNPHQCHKMAPIFFFSPFPFFLQIDFGFFFLSTIVSEEESRGKEVEKAQGLPVVLVTPPPLNR